MRPLGQDNVTLRHDRVAAEYLRRIPVYDRPLRSPRPSFRHDSAKPRPIGSFLVGEEASLGALQLVKHAMRETTYRGCLRSFSRSENKRVRAFGSRRAAQTSSLMHSSVVKER